MILHARLLTFMLNWSNDSKIGVNLYMHFPYSLISLTCIRSPLCKKKNLNGTWRYVFSKNKKMSPLPTLYICKNKQLEGTHRRHLGFI